MDWSQPESGDCVYAPEAVDLEQAEVLRRVAVSFRRVVIDWAEGDRWVETRIAKAVETGYRGLLLEAERALRGRVALVSVSDTAGAEAIWVWFYLTRDSTGLLELHYQLPETIAACRELAGKLAGVLGYKFATWEDGDDAGSFDRRGAGW